MERPKHGIPTALNVRWLENLGDDNSQRLESNRLSQLSANTISLELLRFTRIGPGPESDNGNRTGIRLGKNPPDELDTVHVNQLGVGQYQVDRMVSEHVQQLITRSSLKHAAGT